MMHFHYVRNSCAVWKRWREGVSWLFRTIYLQHTPYKIIFYLVGRIFFKKVGICHVYPYCLGHTWTENNFFRIHGDSNYNEKKYWNYKWTQPQNFMDTKFNIPRISTTYVSVAPRAAIFTSFEARWKSHYSNPMSVISSFFSRTRATRGYLLLNDGAYWETVNIGNKLQCGLV